MPSLARIPMPAPTSEDLLVLADLWVEAERRLASGPWDKWDEMVLVAWRDAAKDQFRTAVRVSGLPRYRP